MFHLLEVFDMGNRKSAEKIFMDGIKALEKIIGTKNNTELYTSFFKDLSDKEFESLIVRMEEENMVLPIFVENMGKGKLDSVKIREYGEKLGVNWFQHIVYEDPITGKTHKTPIKYLVMDVPVRRLAQHVFKKASIPENNKKVDQLSGQATGTSKGATISRPELQLLNDLGLNDTILELIKVRGGDSEAYREMEHMVEETGGYSVEAIKNLGTRPKSVDVLKQLLLAAHISSTL